MVTPRTAVFACVFALPFAGATAQVSNVSASRSVEIFLSAANTDEPATTFSDSASSALIGPFMQTVSGDVQDSSPQADADGTASQTSDISNAGGFLLAQSASTIRVDNRTLSQNGAATTDVDSVFSIDFDVDAPSAWQLAGEISALINLGDFPDGSSLSIELTGPSGAILSESFNIFDTGIDPFGIPASSAPIDFDGVLNPGAHTLSITHSGFSNLNFGSARSEFFEFAYDLTFSVPAPSTLALLALAPVATRRKR